MRLGWIALLATLAVGCGEGADDDSGMDDDDTVAADDDSGADDDDSAEDPCTAPEGEVTFDGYGGDERVQLEATGFFRVEELCERWWLVTPDGHPFYSTGVNHITPYGDTGRETGAQNYAETVNANYKSQDAWADAAVERLTSWNLNTAGCWSTSLMDTRMPYTPSLDMAADDWVEGTVADYFDPDWIAAVEANAAAAADRVGDPALVGYFIDNEIRWGPDWRGFDTLLQLYLQLPAEAPGKGVAAQLLLDELGGVEGINEALGTSFADEDALLGATDGWDALDYDCDGVADDLTGAFVGMAAEQYFATTAGAIRAVDPDHMVLGNREVSVTTRLEVYAAAAAHLDVLSINNYVFFDVVTEACLSMSGSLDPADGFAELHQHVDLPILITEFGFRADDSGLPNTWPPQYPTLETQADRADAFEEYALDRQAVPWIVGYHWFEWVDQPPDGRFDGEDNNWGLVSEQDVVYEEVTQRMAEINGRVPELLRVPR
jgi:hypothetical protein